MQNRSTLLCSPSLREEDAEALPARAHACSSDEPGQAPRDHLLTVRLH